MDHLFKLPPKIHTTTKRNDKNTWREQSAVRVRAPRLRAATTAVKGSLPQNQAILLSAFSRTSANQHPPSLSVSELHSRMGLITLKSPVSVNNNNNNNITDQL